MKFNSLTISVIAAVIVYFCISFSRKTDSSVAHIPEIKLPEVKQEVTIIEEESRGSSIKTLTESQLLALDPETTIIIQNAAIASPEETAEWAKNLEGEYYSQKVLELVLFTWADQTPRTCAAWLEEIPLKQTTYGYYAAVVKAWAVNSPENTVEWIQELEIKVRNQKMLRPNLYKEAIRIWSQTDFREAASWLRSSEFSADVYKLLYPTLVQSGFEQSPLTLFDWLSQIKSFDKADVYSLYYMKEWIYRDYKSALKWLQKADGQTYIESLKDIAAQTVAIKDSKLCARLIKEPNMAKIKPYLIKARIAQMSIKDPNRALSELEKIKDYKLRNSICETVALSLVGKRREAIDFVKSAGFITFAKLTNFFSLWGEISGEPALKWLLKNDREFFVVDFYNQMARKWNFENPNRTVALIKSSKEIENIKKTLPKELRFQLSEKLNHWSSEKEKLIYITAKSWAKKRYLLCLNYLKTVKDKKFQSQGLRGAFSSVTKNDIELSFKFINEVDNPDKREFYSIIAVARALQNPKGALVTLQSRGLVKLDYVIGIIENTRSRELNTLPGMLKNLEGEFSHIYFPYFFYHFAHYDRRNAVIYLKNIANKSTKNPGKIKINYATCLQAIAASFKDDYSPRRFAHWYNGLNKNQQQIIDQIPSFTPAN